VKYSKLFSVNSNAGNNNTKENFKQTGWKWFVVSYPVVLLVVGLLQQQ
jgi:hypothetical protein